MAEMVALCSSTTMPRWLNWRLFFIVVSETFGARGGAEWGVSHYLMAKP